MRVLILACFAFSLFSCNSSSKKKDPNRAMDDTARMDNPVAPTPPIVPIVPEKITVADIPSGINVKGKVLEVWRWNDNLGENILITSYVTPYADKGKNEYGEEGQTAELHAFQYARKEGDYLPIWVLNDSEKSCPFDITCDFIKGSTTITDLDKDGIAETKVQYSVACRSDVSPATMKLIMCENGITYALRGSMWLRYSPEVKFMVTEKDVNLESTPKLKDEMEELLRTFGRYENEKEFADAPSQFLPFARSEWLKYVKEKIGE
ncbi:MAG: hypothetical protein WAT34_10225 [Chitinophagaceae bacterium]